MFNLYGPMEHSLQAHKPNSWLMRQLKYGRVFVWTVYTSFSLFLQWVFIIDFEN